MKKLVSLTSADGKTPEQIYEEILKSMEEYSKKNNIPFDKNNIKVTFV